MLKFFNILKLIFKEKKIVKSYNSDDDLEQFVSRRINSKLKVNKTQKHENELLKNLAGLRGITAIDVMVPRVDIVTVSMSDNFNDIVNQLTKANHSRVPVTGETKDDIVGIIHIKDVLANINSKKKNRIKYILKDPIFIAPSISLLDLLDEMRLKKRHMALVVDEYGGIDGLVTIEDLVEELVGEIEDEHDETSEIKIEKLNFSILLTNDAEIKEINFKYRNLDKPTNVLSFQSIIDKNNYFKNTDQEIHLGEIIISMERIFSESKINNVLFKDHFIHIFLHAILHILGYDHEINSERIKMEKIEISILKNLGIKNPYA